MDREQQVKRWKRFADTAADAVRLICLTCEDAAVEPFRQQLSNASAKDIRDLPFPDPTLWGILCDAIGCSVAKAVALRTLNTRDHACRFEGDVIYDENGEHLQRIVHRTEHYVIGKSEPVITTIRGRRRRFCGLFELFQIVPREGVDYVYSTGVTRKADRRWYRNRDVVIAECYDREQGWSDFLSFST